MERVITLGSGAAWRWEVPATNGAIPVVFLHGFLGSGSDWEDIAGRMPERYSCFLPTLPGSGANPAELRSIDHPLSIELAAAELLECIEQLALTPAVFVGYSLGARIALRAVLERPAAVRALVLEGVNPGIEHEQEREARRNADRALAERLRREPFPEFLRWWYEELPLFSSLNKKLQLLQTLYERRRRECSPEWIAKGIYELSPGLMESMWERLPELRMPVLAVNGNLDAKFDEICQRVAARCPRAARAIIIDAGHNTHFEQPERYLEQLLAFLEREVP